MEGVVIHRLVGRDWHCDGHHQASDSCFIVGGRGREAAGGEVAAARWSEAMLTSSDPAEA